VHFVTKAILKSKSASFNTHEVHEENLLGPYIVNDPKMNFVVVAIFGSFERYSM
jgi:hypothetical protein